MKAYHGSIVTCDGADSVRSWLVEERGRIAWVGNELPERFAGAERVELAPGAALVPSFADTHMHFASFALFHSGLDVRSARGIPEIQQRLKEFAARCRADMVVGFGASVHSVSERRLITREELDAACPDRPVFIVKYDGHACLVNSKLISMLPSHISGLRGYHADTGEMNQEAYFACTDFVTNAIPPLQVVRNMAVAAAELVSRGIGKVDDVSGVGFPKDLDVDLERWFARGLASGLQMRIFFQTMDIAKVRRRGLPRIGGCFATALDGCFGSMDAALLEPYRGTDSRGVLFYDDATVRKFCIDANRAGLQIEMHAIGDAAFVQAVDAIEAALRDTPRQDHRHGIIHACLPTPDGLRKCAELGIHIPLQPGFLAWELEPLQYIESILGDRAFEISPLRTMADLGVRMSGGSDAPCTLPDPIAGMHAACNHYVAGQSLTPREALSLYTIDGFRTTFDDGERGSLEKGKCADMVILDANPLDTPASELGSIKVDRVILAGHEYDGAVPGAVATMLRGLFSRGQV
ncbi:MAG TPA: amidohydrolase family protein [Myxococcota bacterium]|nr:amidohydrolase family protein [Myxococcota bacterium]HPB50833.1 amidohydrolase family protein [Myxococcota bacterium]HQP95489.1 amidohydrolase family protein [Myxococcota bacterium]